MKKLAVIAVIILFSCTKEKSQNPQAKYTVVNVWSKTGALLASDTTEIR